jgi:foldase protein PrsA
MRWMMTGLVLAVTMGTACEKKQDGQLAPSGMAGTKTPSPAAAGSGGEKADPNQQIATVGDKLLTRVDLDRAINSLLSSVGVPPDRVDATMTKMVEARAMQTMIQREILKQEASRRGHVIEPAELDGALGKFKAQLPAGIPYDTWLTRMGLTDPVFRDELAGNLLINKLQNEVLQSVKPPSDQELKALYETEKDKLAKVEKGKAHQILIAVPPDAPFEMVEEARKEAAGVAAGLKGKGLKAFEKVAREKSEDDATKAKGGDLGSFEARTVLPDFWMAFSSLNKGEVSDPVRIDKGFVIIRSDGRERGKDRTFDETKPQLIAMEAQKRNGAAMAEMMKGLMEKAKVERHYEPPPPPSRPAPGGPMAEGPGPGGAPLPPAAGMPGAMPPGGTPLPPGKAHALPEMPTGGNMPLPSADNVLPGVRNPHGGGAPGAPHGGGAPQHTPPSADELQLVGSDKKPAEGLQLNP